jgi:hypothetical protein
MKTSILPLLALTALVASAGNQMDRPKLKVGPAIASAAARAAQPEDCLESAPVSEPMPAAKAVAAEEASPSKAKGTKRSLPSRAQLWLT